MTEKPRVMFMGTPEFAAEVFKALCVKENVVAAVTRADKPQGRKKELLPTPVKREALLKDIPVYAPETLKDGAFRQILEKHRPELIVVAAYGKLLPEYILNYPKLGCINVHGSLLPKYRGAAPVQRAVINGEKKTGITIMRMDKGLDTGDIIISEETEIKQNETAGELMERLSPIGAALVLKAIELIKRGEAVYTRQDDSKATYAPMLDKNMAEIDFQRPAEAVRNFINGLNPWPVAFAFYEGKKLKALRAKSGESTAMPAGYALASGEGIEAACGDGRSVIITEVLLEGSRAMSAPEFLAGHAMNTPVPLFKSI